MRATFVDHPPRLWQAFCFKFYAELLGLGQGHPDHRQRKPKPQFVLQEDLDMMKPELLELHAAEIMDVGRMAFHLLQLELNLGLRQDLLLVHPDDPRFLPESSRAATPARPDAKAQGIDRQGGRRDHVDDADERLHPVDLATDG